MEHIQTALREVQEGLFADAKAFRDANIKDVATYDELKQAVAEGYWARGPWAGKPFVTAKILVLRKALAELTAAFEGSWERERALDCRFGIFAGSSNIRYQTVQARSLTGYVRKGCNNASPCLFECINLSAGSDEDETRIKQETMATLRCIPFDQPSETLGACFMTGKDAQEVAIFAKAY